MTAVAIIVEYQTPDLLALCLASLKRFAPEVRPILIAGEEGAAAHAAGIEAVRRRGIGAADIVILVDTDSVILSDVWLPWVEAKLEEVSAVGGLRHRGDVAQVYCQGHMLLHAHCLAMTRALFEKVPTFRAEGVWDTAWQVTWYAGSESTVVVPMMPTPDGWPDRVGIYLTFGDRPMWAHLGRGTSFRPRSGPRETLRKIVAGLGSPRAKKILSYQQDRQEFLRKGWEIVRA